MNSIIEIIPPYTIAYIRSMGPYGANNVHTMEEMKRWSKSNKLLDNESIILGIAQDDPRIINPDNCRYDTCIVVSNDFSVTDDYVKKGFISGGKYAIFKIAHTVEAVQEAWIEIFPELSRQGYQIDERRPIMERYIVKMVNNHFCEICVPIY